MVENIYKPEPIYDGDNDLTEKKLLTYKFDVITVNFRGEKINRENKQAKYFTVDLGNGVTMEMVEIPGGNFIMGSPATEYQRYDDESPQHEVRIPLFYMDKYERNPNQ